MKAILWLICVSVFLFSYPARAEEENGKDSATVTATIRVVTPDESIRADNLGRCWIGNMLVDCLTQDEIPVEMLALNSTGTVPKSTLPRASVE